MKMLQDPFGIPFGPGVFFSLFLTLKDGRDRLSQNVGKEIAVLAA